MGLIMNQFTLLQNQIQKLNQKIDFNNINNQQELEYDNGRYVGQVVNGSKEGKGIFYLNYGDRYEGDWRNDKREGKGIFYYNNGDREMGDYLNDNKIGIHVKLKINGEVKRKEY